MSKKTEKVVNIDLLKNDDIELSSIYDADLMNIRCFATTEGINFNGTKFRREVLAKSYLTFVDKPVIMVPDKTDCPTGHGFDFKAKTFDMDKRKYIGHIVGATQVVVDEEDNIHYIDDLPMSEVPDGEYRIVVDLVIYKRYLGNIAQQLEFLHSVGDLNFSMEANVDAVVDDDGIKDCTSILFTGLAIVANPAFVNAKSIEVAEEKGEEDNMDFETMYNDLKAKYDVQETELASARDELSNAKDSLNNTKEDLANSKAELAEAQSTIETLKPFKEQVEIAEKEKLGQERLAKLEKFGDKDHDAKELAEVSKEEFADMLVAAADNMKVEKSPVEMGIPQVKVEMTSNKDKLSEILSKM